MHKKRKSTQDDQAMFHNIHKQFLSPDHVARQATGAERMLQKSHYNSKKKGWDWNKYVTLHKDQHMIMESLADHVYSGINNDTKVCQFLKEIKSTESEAVVNVVQTQSEKCGKDFDTMVFYLGQMVMKNDYNIQSVYIAKNRSQLAKPKVALSWRRLNARSTTKQSEVLCLENSRCRLEIFMNNKASSLPPSSLVQRLELLLSRHS